MNPAITFLENTTGSDVSIIYNHMRRAPPLTRRKTRVKGGRSCRIISLKKKDPPQRRERRRSSTQLKIFIQYSHEKLWYCNMGDLITQEVQSSDISTGGDPLLPAGRRMFWG